MADTPLVGGEGGQRAEKSWSPEKFSRTSGLFNKCHFALEEHFSDVGGGGRGRPLLGRAPNAPPPPPRVVRKQWPAPYPPGSGFGFRAQLPSASSDWYSIPPIAFWYPRPPRRYTRARARTHTYLLHIGVVWAVQHDVPRWL